MKWCTIILALGLLAQTIADPGPVPDPKKYKPESKDKPTKITEEEKTFIREVEAKYGIKSENTSENKDSEKGEVKVDTKPQSFPAVIAIEIVNDTETAGKGKRTIDANLGYGYRTNNGYTYTYFGKPKQEQGKFVIYPYSQEDIPAHRHSQQPLFQQQPQYHTHNAKLSHSKHYQNPFSSKSQNVEIQPSQAYELVPATEESTYQSHHEPVSEIKTQHERIQSLQAPPPPQSQVQHAGATAQVPSTLFTTYNAGQLSGLTGQFPAVMSNYFVDSSQLLQNPQFQSVGLTPDHLRQHGPTVDQRVVPVLVLRIPSSHLSNPSADLYPNLPSNYPLSHYLNNVNLQDLVANYFKKIGYPHIPQVMTHFSPLASAAPQYSAPAAAPQYSAPVSAPQYTAPAAAPQYSAPLSTQQYSMPVSALQYSAQVSNPSVKYTMPAATIAQYGAQALRAQYETQQYAVPEPTPTYTHTDYSGVQYSAVQPVMARYPVVGQRFTMRDPHTGQETLYEYVNPRSANFRQYLQSEYQHPHYQTPQYEFQYVEGPSAQNQQYQQQTEAERQSSQQSEASAKGHSTYGPPKTVEVTSQTAPESSGNAQLYHQQTHVTANAESHAYSTSRPLTQEDKNVPISENYPSNDHTRVTVIPHYKSQKQRGKQTVSYVTPSSLSGGKYNIPYNIMAPQSVLGEQQEVAYVNSHSIPTAQRGANAVSSTGMYVQYPTEVEQPTDSSYLPPVGTQKAPSYPRNYHAHAHTVHHSKRMTTTKQDYPKANPAAKKPETTEKRPLSSSPPSSS